MTKVNRKLNSNLIKVFKFKDSVVLFKTSMTRLVNMQIPIYQFVDNLRETLPLDQHPRNVIFIPQFCN